MTTPGTVDLHLHSTESDGRLTPADLIRLAHRNGVRRLALTDHDSTAGLPEARETGRALGVEYDDDEELQGGDEIAARDRHRWELDPESKDDFDDEA